MKTTSIGAKMARLHSGIGSAIMSLATARGLDLAVWQAAFAPPKRARVRATKSGGRHEERSAGAKLRRAAHNGTLTVRHASATDQYWRDVYAKRITAASAKRQYNAMQRAATKASELRKFAFGQ